MRTNSPPPVPQGADPSRHSRDLELGPLLGVSDVAQILGLPKATLYRWHSLSTADAPLGPRAFRVGRYLRYTLGDVKAYIDEMRGSPPEK